MTAHAVNDQGVIAGTGTRSDNLRFALRWTPAAGGYSVEVAPAPGAEYEFVGYSIANGTGWVAGWVRRNVGGSSSKDAFVWTAAGTFRLLGRLSGAATEARGINAAGRVSGWSATAPRGGDSSPVTWTCSETACTAPTVLAMFYRNLNFAMSVNDAGDIVGTSGLDGILYNHCGTTVTLSPPARGHTELWLGGEWRWDGRGRLFVPGQRYDAGDALVTARVQLLSRAWPGSVPVGRLEVLP